jgi:hypothetical protein
MEPPHLYHNLPLMFLSRIKTSMLCVDVAMNTTQNVKKGYIAWITSTTILISKFLTLDQTPHKLRRFTSKVIATNIAFDKNQCPIVWLRTHWSTTWLKVFVIALAMAHVSPFSTIVVIGNYSKWWCLKHILKSFGLKLHWKQNKFSLYCP